MSMNTFGVVLPAGKPLDWQVLADTLDSEGVIDPSFGDENWPLSSSIRDYFQNGYFGSGTLMYGILHDRDEMIYVFYSWGGVGEDEQGTVYHIMREAMGNDAVRQALGVLRTIN